MNECPVCGGFPAGHASSGDDLCTCEPRYQTEVQELEEYLKIFTPIAPTGTLKERVEKVFMHYATQMGRWNKREREANNGRLPRRK